MDPEYVFKFNELEDLNTTSTKNDYLKQINNI